MANPRQHKDNVDGGEHRGGSGLEGILHGFTNLVEKLGELAEKGQEFSHSGEIHGKGPQKDAMHGVYGLNIKFGLGNKEMQVEPFGNIHKDKVTGETKIQEAREPLVDILEEKDHTLIVAEMPGIHADDVDIEVKDDVLILSAEKDDKKYRREILLPRSYPREKMKVSSNNGIIEIRCYA